MYFCDMCDMCDRMKYGVHYYTVTKWSSSYMYFYDMCDHLKYMVFIIYRV